MVSRSQKRDTECLNEEFNYPMLQEARGEREAPPGPGWGGGLCGDNNFLSQGGFISESQPGFTSTPTSSFKFSNLKII